MIIAIRLICLKKKKKKKKKKKVLDRFEESLVIGKLKNQSKRHKNLFDIS